MLAISETKFITISDRKVPLKEAQEFVEGWVEVVRSIDRKASYLVNEEGKIIGLPINQEASNDAGIMLVGNVIKVTGIAKRAWR